MMLKYFAWFCSKQDKVSQSSRFVCSAEQSFWFSLSLDLKWFLLTTILVLDGHITPKQACRDIRTYIVSHFMIDSSQSVLLTRDEAVICVASTS